MMIDFNTLWRYFAWTNQMLAACTLWACTVYLARKGKAYALTLVPAAFMTSVVVSYILYAPSPEGFGLPWGLSAGLGAGASAACTAAFLTRRGKERKTTTEITD
jgi:carbon starvation protein CstA